MSARKRRKKTKKKSVVDSAARNAASITDGCNLEFVKGATFDGIFEMLIIKKPKKIIIPDNAILKQYQGFITPDCSVYRDMPLATQITNQKR
ncbi:MAG: DUF4417 domain-containing protein [Tyzzerella sp.]|nr:DUF4417 domain-containing protein [Tyzzerella sp.]